jgi:hypothetical protein
MKFPVILPNRLQIRRADHLDRRAGEPSESTTPMAAGTGVETENRYVAFRSQRHNAVL